jgi:hypothetical protein
VAGTFQHLFNRGGTFPIALYALTECISGPKRGCHPGVCNPILGMPRSGPKPKPLELRISAAIIWHKLDRIKGQDRLRAAAEEFKRKHGDVNSRSGQFCKFWGQRFTAEGTVHDAARSGRRQKVSPAAAKQAAALLRAPAQQPGWPQNGYTSCQAACLPALCNMQHALCASLSAMVAARRCSRGAAAADSRR